MELGLTILTLMGLYGRRTGEVFGYEGACRRVFGDVGSAWMLLGGQSVWRVIGEARDYPSLDISPSYEETELAWNYLTGQRTALGSSETITERSSKVGPDGVVTVVSSTRTQVDEVFYVAIPNGAKATVRGRTSSEQLNGEHSDSYLLEIVVNPIGSGIGGRAWKQPIEKSAASVLAGELAKAYGAFRVEPTQDDSNGNPDVKIHFEQRDLLVQHTTFEPSELRVALARKESGTFRYANDDFKTWLSQRLDSKRQDARVDRTLVLDAGFCIPSSPFLQDIAGQVIAQETGLWERVWLLFRLDNIILKLR